MTVIKYCFVNDAKGTDLYSQVSVNDNGATSLYINKEFVINNINIKLIQKSLALQKAFC